MEVFVAASTVAVAALWRRRAQQDAKTALTGIDFNLNTAQIVSTADEIIEESRAVLDGVAAVTASTATFENTVGAIDALEVSINVRTTACTFPKDVSTSRALRDASAEAQQKLSAYEVEASMRLDVYTAVKAFQKKMRAGDGGRLSPEQVRLVDRVVRDFERRGLALPAEAREELTKLKQEISKLQIEYHKNLGEDNTKLTFSREELAGMPDDFIASLERDGDKYVVTLGYPHVVPIGRTCDVEATRAAVEKAYTSRCMETNVKILEDLVALRRQVASLLGFATHADYVLDVQMAKSKETVSEFLEGLSVKLDPLIEDELARLKEAKGSDTFGMWDMRYYMNKETESKYDIDQNALKEYFPLEAVTKGMLHIYQLLLSLEFREVQDPHVWQEDVSMYAVHEASGDKDLLGYFYLDLHPREGKYGHAAVFPLVNGCGRDEAGTLAVKPAAAMVANFTKPTADRPSLLMHQEVVTYFHEFGHVMHHICSKTETHHFSSFSCEQDFVEAPSQMLENWAWSLEPLQLMSGHYITGEPIPEEMARKLAATKNAHAGLLNKRQLLFAMFDQYIHSRETDEPVDTAAILKKFHDTVMRIPMTPGTNFSAGFGHLAGGYDARYYGYMWSEVYSADMFSRFSRDGVLNIGTGGEYRTAILQPGGSRDAMDSITEFLGRKPTMEAFLKDKGLCA